MESENEEKGAESGSESREQTEQPPQSKLRDLRPEKDPMGAGKENARPVAPR